MDGQMNELMDCRTESQTGAKLTGDGPINKWINDRYKGKINIIEKGWMERQVDKQTDG